MSALKAFARQQEFKRQREEQLANRPAPTPDDLYRFARYRLRHDPASARRFAGLEDPPPFVPSAVESPPVDWQKIAGGLMQDIEGLMQQQSMQRSARSRYHDDAVPADATPAPVAPPPAKPAMPREVTFERDTTGRIVGAAAAGKKFAVVRDRAGNFVGLDGDKHSIQITGRDANGHASKFSIKEKS